MSRPIPDDVLHLQIETSDPNVSAWVAANAGSGKTYVLAQRVIRLMLAGIEPAKILCLTFTKAAAANMANRVFETLARWTALDDEALDHAIARIDGEWPDARRTARARRLFALALDTPGGLKVQTIHAFCTRLLHQFPFEANVAARFTVLEDRAERDLLARLRLEVLLEGAAAPDGPLGRALATAIASAADRTLVEVIEEAIRERDRLVAWIERAGGIADAVAELCLILGVSPGESGDDLDARLTQGPDLPASEWPAIARALSEGSASDLAQAERFDRAAATTGDARRAAYLSVFINGEGKLRSRIVTKALALRHPGLECRLAAEQERVIALDERRRAVAARDRTAALLTIADAVIARYRVEKDLRGYLDYDDLIDRTLALLTNVEAAWVHYKLDLGIDHVLIDEAQDTSPKQWEIVKKLTAEFTSGEGARALRRTVFAVGDEKQSIFSFQGAVPDKFAETRIHFQAAHRAGDLEFVHREFKHSFRSGPNVLGAVDAVFHDPCVHRSVVADGELFPPHIALPDAAPGLVEIWAPVVAEKPREVDGWDAPFDEVSETSPQVRLADRIAATIGSLTRRGVGPKDVLILVRQRGPLFETIIRALKNARIPVAGADRLVLTEHIAIMDLMALADALLLPEDDLALATVLRSPLFGLDEEALFALAWGRPGTLRAALLARSGEPRFAEVIAKLDRLTDAARRDSPFAFYAGLLGREGGRRQMLARLGSEADDALDEFLSLALAYEAQQAPSLQGFMAWLRAAQTEIKRDMDLVRDEVRVMTVHGAKGLEAPIVILADTVTRPTGPRDPRLLALPAVGLPPGTPDRLVWAAARHSDVGPIREAREQARAAAQHEYRRLLYVAMTRAADRLIVCAAQGQNQRPPGCWYDLVAAALSPAATEEPAEDGGGVVLRWRHVPADGRAPPVAGVGAAQMAAAEMPPWLMRPAPGDAAPARSVSPSRAVAEDDTGPRPEAARLARSKALARGTLVHRLLQTLPDILAERRAGAALRFLARRGDMFDAAERDAMLAQVFAILADPAFAPLFAGGSRAEVPLIGRLRRAGGPPLTVSGLVDRLAVTADAVYVADYKTNSPPPRRIDDVPDAYVTQLAIYRGLLSQVFPGRPVRALLIWTEIPDLMELPAAVLEAAFRRMIERG
ncbi:MAG: double-strand break repair helicase AddA [Xanthobacteraceae bacterium]